MKLQKIALLIFTFISFTTFSQTEKGKYLIGVSSNLNFNFDANSAKGKSFSRDAGSSKEFSISSEAGYAFKKNLFIGLTLTYGYSDIDDKDYGYESITNSISASPFIKYYFSEKKIKPFLIASYGLGAEKSRTRFIFGTNTFNTQKAKLTALNFGGGLSYFFNKSVNVEFSLNYFRSTRDLDDQQNETYITNRINSNIGFAIFL